MQLNISFKHMDPSDTLKIFIEEKSSSLAKYFNGKISVNWNLAVERQSRVAHCHLIGNSMDYFGHSETDDFRSSIEIALDKIEVQVRKHKEIVTGHRPGRQPHPATVEPEFVGEDEE